jgi:hypothetical protein
MVLDKRGSCLSLASGQSVVFLAVSHWLRLLGSTIPTRHLADLATNWDDTEPVSTLHFNSAAALCWPGVASCRLLLYC